MRADARTCRERALECAIRALTDRDPQRKQLFTRLFHTWTSMAVESERVALPISDRLPAEPPPTASWWSWTPSEKIPPADMAELIAETRRTYGGGWR
jgi:hypothetical protein